MHKQSAGRLTREQAQQMALRAVAALRYDGSGHFWISDMQPRMLMHPLKPELDGQRLGESKDADGRAPFDAFVATVRNDSKGFVAQQWPEPGSAPAQDKVAYVMGFEPWGWVLGSGRAGRTTCIQPLARSGLGGRRGRAGDAAGRPTCS